MRRIAPIALGVLAVAGLAWYALAPPPPLPPPAMLDVAALLGAQAPGGFARAHAPRPFAFPRDHGPHPEYRTEWWYFTGNLGAPDGRRFGYELALFRVALSPAPAARGSHWASNQVYMAHFALTDAGTGRFHYGERLARGAGGLAGATGEPFAVWVADWGVRAAPDGIARWRLAAAADDAAVALTLRAVKPIVLQGEHGLSRKSAEPGNASYYYSIPRLATEGTVSVGGKTLAVSGSSWFDREWGTSALAAEQVGWDWFALQLDDGHELMFYRLRRRDDGADPFSNGAWIDAAGDRRRLDAHDVRLEVSEHWTSPRGGRYPARWQLDVPALQLALEVVPLLPDQELALSVRYWEGAVDVRGTRAGRAVSGVGYVELTGYAADRGR